MVTFTEKFLATDTSVAKTATETDGTDFTSKQINTKHAHLGSITCYVKGANAGSSGDVTFKFATYDVLREMWDTIYYVQVVCALNGTTAVQKTITFYPDMQKLKLLSIQNEDTTYAATCNASVTIKERHA